jgi:hypothetical protein
MLLAKNGCVTLAAARKPKVWLLLSFEAGRSDLKKSLISMVVNGSKRPIELGRLPDKVAVLLKYQGQVSHHQGEPQGPQKPH